MQFIKNCIRYGHNKRKRYLFGGFKKREAKNDKKQKVAGDF
jgi:hypothetical protein